MKSNYFALVTLPKPISLTNCALGHKFSATIGGHKLHMHTPVLLSADENTSNHNKFGSYHSNLAQPKISSQYILSDAELDWGSLHSANGKGKVTASVKHLFAVFPETPADIVKFSHEVHDATYEWFQNFDSFLRVISNQRMSSFTRVEGQANNCLNIHQHRPWMHLQPKPYRITVHVADRSIKNFAIKEDFRQAANLCSKEKKLALQYQLLLRSCDAFHENDFRSVVIEAATALEVATTRRIRTEMQKTKATEQHIKLMLDGHKMLRNRLELLKKMKVTIPCPKNNVAELLELRNKVVHVGKSVDAQQARKVLLDTETIIRSITPDIAEDAN